ncbi:hypothetical protein MUBE_12290 [Mycobacterium uberis]|uniref:PE domain-containing protein n=1 Tax=Mycobacterium uberis TaxID=2162698 RepID=A0A3E1HEP8_9MYCO|nr:hypothetical protein MUBE_12290 [Mycobacterium uberis]
MIKAVRFNAQDDLYQAIVAEAVVLHERLVNFVAIDADFYADIETANTTVMEVSEAATRITSGGLSSTIIARRFSWAIALHRCSVLPN